MIESISDISRRHRVSRSLSHLIIFELQFTTHQDPVQVVLSDSETFIRATIALKAVQCFEEKWHHSITKDTTGGLIQLLDFEVVATHLGDPKLQLTLLINELRYLGCSHSGTYGRPESIETREGIREFLSDLRKVRRQEEVPVPLSGNRVGSLQADQGEDMSGSDEQGGEEDDRSKQIYMTQLPTREPGKRRHRVLDDAVRGSQGLIHAQRAEYHPNVPSSYRRDKAQKVANGAKRCDTLAVSVQPLPAACGHCKSKGSRTNDSVELLGLLKTKHSLEHHEPADSRTLPLKQLPSMGATHALIQNRSPPDQKTEQVEEPSPSDKKPGPGPLNIDEPITTLPKSQEHTTTYSKVHIDNTHTESLGNRGRALPEDGDPWKGMSRIRSKDITIPASQQILLDRDDCWLPAEPGKRGPVANLPVSIIESLSTEVDQQAAHLDETTLPPLLLGDDHDEAESLSLPDNGEIQDDRDSEGDSAISSSDWPLSSPRNISKHNQLPPNSSAEYPSRETLQNCYASTPRMALSNADSSSRSMGKKSFFGDADLDGKHITGCSRPQSLTGEGPSQADPSYVSSFPNPSRENRDILSGCGPSDLAGTHFNESTRGEPDSTLDRLGVATKLEESDLAEYAASLDQTKEEILEHNKKALAPHHNDSMLDHAEDTSLSVLNTSDQGSLPAANAIIEISDPKLLHDLVETSSQNYRNITKTDKVVIDLDSASSSSSESELEPVAPNALPLNLGKATCNERAKSTPVKAHGSTLQVDRTPCLPDGLAPSSLNFVEVPGRQSCDTSDLHSDGRKAGLFRQDEIADDVVIPATFDIALSSKNGRTVEGDATNGVPLLRKPTSHDVGHGTNETAESRYIKQTNPAHHTTTNGKRNMAENEASQSYTSSRKKRLRMADVTSAGSENQRLSLAQQIRQYRREVFAAAGLRRQAREQPERQSDTGDLHFDQKYRGVRAPSEESSDKMVLSSPTYRKKTPRFVSVRSDHGPSLGETKDAIPEVINTIEQQSPQALRSPPLSDYEIAVFARPTQLTIYSRFKEAYPAYKSNEKHFVAMCKKIETLEKENRMEHRSLWDDFIIQHEGAYRQYLLDCAEQVEDPLPYEVYYRKEIDDPRFMKRIVTPANLRDVLSLEKSEAQKDSIPSETPKHSNPSDTPKHEKVASQKPTPNRPLGSSPIEIDVDLTTERLMTSPISKPLISSSSKPEKNHRKLLPWLADGEGLPSRNISCNYLSNYTMPSTVPATTGPSKLSDMRPSSTQPLPSLSILGTDPPLGCTKKARNGLKPTIASSHHNSEASFGFSQRAKISSPNPASSSLLCPTNLIIPQDRCKRKSDTVISDQVPKSIPPSSVSSEWWRDPASPFKSFARADAAIRGGNGNAFADKKAKQVRVEWPVVEKGIVKAYMKSLNVLDWEL